jgi:2-dehydrotetronate isomerase
MPNFAANLTMMFTEWPLLERFAAAADAGFTAVEILFPYELTPDAIASSLARNHLTLALFNLPPGDWAAGERGLAALPDRFDELKNGLEKALDYIQATGVKRVHLMAGLADRGDPAALSSYRRSVRYCAEKLRRAHLDLLLEPINNRNMPGYFLNDFNFTEAVISELALPNLKLQFDIYHRQIIHGDVTTALRRVLPVVGHIQIASVPSRHEPDDEELNYPFIFSELDRLGYTGFVGCEYNPRGHTTEGLRWFFAHKPVQRNFAPRV